MSERHIIVIGGGLSGVMAALSSKSAGCRVTLIRGGLGRTALGNGLVRLAGIVRVTGSSRYLPLMKSVKEMLRGNPEHPFLRLEIAESEAYAARDLFVKIVNDGYFVENADADLLPSWFANEIGNLEAAHFAPLSTARFHRESRESVGVVGFSGYRRFHAEYLAESWTRHAEKLRLPVTFAPVSISFDKDGKPFRKPAETARALEKENELSRLTEMLRKALENVEVNRLVFPPVLGMDGSLAKELEKRLNLPVGEAAGARESLAGLRLIWLLEAFLIAEGVEIVSGTAREPEMDSGAIRSVETASGKEENRRLEADAFVLATGKFLGGGIRSVEGRFVEPLFSLPVFSEGRRIEDDFIGKLTRNDFSAPQAFERVGLRADLYGRPVAEGGGVCYPNLFAAGQVIGGFDPNREGAEGVDLISGYLAGKRAGETDHA